MTDMFRLGYVANVVAHAIKAVLEGGAGYDGNRGDGRFFQEGLDDVSPEEAAAANDEACAEIWFVGSDIDDTFVVLAL